MKIQKSQLLQIIKESEFDMDEMAAHLHPEYRALDYGTKLNKKGNKEVPNIVGHRMKAGSEHEVRNSGGAERPAYIVLYTCGDEVQQFIETHQDLLDHIKKEFMDPESKRYLDIGSQAPDIIFTNAPICDARPYSAKKTFFDAQGNVINPGIPDFPYKWSGEHFELKEAINRHLLQYLTELADDRELKQHLEECNIPQFRVGDRKYQDRHDNESTNQRIHYGTDSLLLFERSEDFLGDTLNKSLGIETDVDKRHAHLARLRNLKYRKWNKERKNEVKWEGLTDIYQLEKYGLAEANYDVNIYAKFDVFGIWNNDNTLTWTLTNDIKYGRKLPTQGDLTGKNMKPFKLIRTDKIAELDKDYPHLRATDRVPLDDNIMSDPNVVNALIEAISEFKQQHMEITSEDALEMANYFEFEVGGEMGEQMYESINKTIKEVIKESNIKRTVRIKQSDLIKIISETVVKKLTEENFDDFITKNKNKNEEAELNPPNHEKATDNQSPEGNEESPEGEKNQVRVELGKDDKGNYFIIKDAGTDHAKIIAMTK